MFKKGVRFTPTLSPIWIGVQVAEQIYSEMGYDCVVTSWADGEHQETSLHWIGHAVDLRTAAAGIWQDEAREIAARMKMRLPDAEFDVVVEDNHIHLEYQPAR